jgi:hypothetical protein
VLESADHLTLTLAVAAEGLAPDNLVTPERRKGMTFQHSPVPVVQAQPHLLAARQADFEAVATLFGELHQYQDE